MVLCRNIKTSKKNSSHRCAGSWVLCQEMWPSITRQLGMSQGHTGLMLCALITAMPSFRKVSDVVCRSALNAVPEFCTDSMLGKGGQEKVHPGQHRLGKHASLVRRAHPNIWGIPMFLQLSCSFSMVSCQGWSWILLLPSLLRCCTAPQNWPQCPEPSFELHAASSWLQLTECREEQAGLNQKWISARSVLLFLRFPQLLWSHDGCPRQSQCTPSWKHSSCLVKPQSYAHLLRGSHQ